jgi:replicative DNA helicase
MTTLTKARRNNEFDVAAGQLTPVGPHPTVDVLLVGSLLWSSPKAASGVLELVLDDDIESPALARVLESVRQLADAGGPCGPQLVADELRRNGSLTRHVAGALQDATTAGAEPLAARQYAAGAVAQSLRRRVESAGHTLLSVADSAAERDIGSMVLHVTYGIADCAGRLIALRGEP